MIRKGCRKRSSVYLQDIISGHKGTIEVTMKRHISISFTTGDIFVSRQTSTTSGSPPGTSSFLSVGRWRSPSVVEGLWLLTGWRSFRPPWRLSSLLRFFTILHCRRSHCSGDSTTSRCCFYGSPRTTVVDAWRPFSDMSGLVTRWTLASTAAAVVAAPRSLPRRLQYLRYMLL